MSPKSVTKDEFTAYMGKVGQARALDRFSLLAKMNKFIAAYESPLGQELLRDLKEREVQLSINQIMGRYKTQEERDEERLELRAVVSLGIAWADKVNNYYKIQNEMQAAAK